MANVSRVNGFRPVKSGTGAPYNGQANLYFLPAADSTVVMVGDLVQLHGTASPEGYPTVTRMSNGATSVCVGVVVGFLPENIKPGSIAGGRTPNLDTPVYRVASTDRYVLVADDPGIIMEAQEDAVGGALAITNVGQNVGVDLTAGNTSTGTSGMSVDSSTAATTSTHPLRIAGFVNRPDNEVGNANAKVHVGFNTHQYKSVGNTGI